MGGHISPILVASKARGIRIIDVRHEVTAVFAADAVARLTGVPGVAAVTAGPGLTNTITAVKNAQMAESPLVLLGGAAATLTQGRGALQDIDQMSVLKPIVKWAARCNTVRDIIPTMRRAFQEAKSGIYTQTQNTHEHTCCGPLPCSDAVHHHHHHHQQAPLVQCLWSFPLTRCTQCRRCAPTWASPSASAVSR